MLSGRGFNMADVNMARKRKSASLETNNLDSPSEISSDDGVQTISDDECAAPALKCPKIDDSSGHNQETNKQSTEVLTIDDTESANLDICDVDSSSSDGVSLQDAHTNVDDDVVEIVDDGQQSISIDSVSCEKSSCNDDDVTIVTENLYKSSTSDADVSIVTDVEVACDSDVEIVATSKETDVAVNSKTKDLLGETNEVEHPTNAVSNEQVENTLEDSVLKQVVCIENLLVKSGEVDKPVDVEATKDDAEMLDNVEIGSTTKNISISNESTPNDIDITQCEDTVAKFPDVDLTQCEDTDAISTDIDMNQDIQAKSEVDTSKPSIETNYKTPISNNTSFLPIVSTTEDTLDQPNKPVISIKFSTKEIFDLYRSKFMTLLSKLPEFSAVQTDNNILLLPADCYDSADDGEIEDPQATSKPVESKSSKKRKRKNKSKPELFMLDTDPTEEDYIVTPKYMSKYKAIDEKIDEEETTKGTSKGGPSNTCFNCSGNHSLRDCPVPKDYAKIQRARANFRTVQVQKVRYHLDEEGGKFPHLVPGQMSSNLRAALGLGKYDTPMHIYRMRVLGYPPGWLDEAMVVHSNLSMFDSDGKDVKGKNKIGGRQVIDPVKVIDYPGFNVSMADGCRDENQLYGVPVFSSMYSKEAMIAYINKVQDKLVDDFEAKDMDIDTGSDKEVLQPPGVSEDSAQRISPTLTDLESKKQELLAQLETRDSATSSPAPSETKSAANKTIDTNNSIADEPSSPCRKVVKTSTFGTPIIKSASPFSILPHPEKFSKDVSPVINFENLPNSTGKYEQMTNVLDKVRKTLKNIQENT